MKEFLYRRTTLLICTVLLLIFAAFGLIFATEATPASAATYTTAKYLTYGSTSNGTSTSSGCPDNFKIYMHGSSTSGTGTIYQDKVLDWSYFYIKVEANKVSKHLTFQLLKNGSVYSNKTLSGKDDLTLFSGSLSDGEYELKYTCRYAPNIFVDYTYYTYTYRFEVDKSAPTYTLKAGGSSISSGSYTNKQIVYTASDANLNYIRYKRPTSSSYSYNYSSSYTVAATDANNGQWYFYAVDDLGATTTTVNVYLDTVKPVGKVTSNGTTVANGGYTNKSFYYTATDTGGVSKYEVKKAGSSVWTTYTSGTNISGTNGWYYFRATDKAGNISDEYSVCYDTGTPTVALYSGTTSVSSGYYSAADYVKFTASDSVSGISYAYVKMPGSSYYSTYTSGSQLTAEGTYTFYAKDKAGNSSAYYTITLDKTKPTGTLYAGTNTVKSGTYTNATYIKFVPSDSVSGISATYVKKPGSASYVSYTSGTQLTDVGTYSFYTRDRSGNQSDTYTITIDRSIPTAQLYADDQPVSNGSYTNTDVTFTWTDEAKVTVKKDGEVMEYVSGKKLTEDGAYEITFENYDGYMATYSFVIDKTAPELKIEGAQNGAATNSNVTVSVPESGLNVQLYKDGKLVGNYESGALITEEGGYRITATDAAGNVTEVSFTIDKSVDFAADIYNNAIVNSMTFTANENLTVNVTKNDEPIAYAFGEVLTEPGNYVVTLTDELGNSEAYSFTITDPLVQSFFHNFDDVLGLDKVSVNGEETRLNYGDLTLDKSGTYEIAVTVNGKDYTFTVTVDSTAPAITLTGVENNGSTKGSVTLSDMTENATVEVYKNGEKINYKLGDELTEDGQYRVVLTDELGNTNEYNFEILYSVNGGAVALIVIVLLVAIGGIVTVIVMRKKGKFGKNKAEKKKAE